jgi:chromosome partitioning protein
MTGLSVALVNLKPGTAKTTSAVWLAHAFHEAGRPVLLVDADPAASALEWSDLAGGFPFRVTGLPVRDLARRVQDIARPGEVVVIDAPQLEDHAGIARSAMRFADEILIPVAPNPIELNRTGPVLAEAEDITAARTTPPRLAVMLNRVVTRATSGTDAREILTEQGFNVLGTVIPRLELFAQSFGGPVTATGTAYEDAATELGKRAGETA